MPIQQAKKHWVRLDGELTDWFKVTHFRQGTADDVDLLRKDQRQI